MNLLAYRVKTYLSVYYAQMAEYRAEIVMWVLAGIFPFIMMAIWMHQADRPGGLAGLSNIDYARYFLAIFVIRQLSVVWVVWELEGDIVLGRLSPHLLQPIDPVWRHLAAHIAERFTRVPLLIVIVAIFLMLFPAAFWIPDPTAALLATIAVVLAFALRFAMQHTFGLLAFWTERASSVEQLAFLPYVFLSGLVAPLSVYPDSVREVALWTPYPYMLAFPAALLTGANMDVTRGFVIVGLWTIGFVGLNRILWRIGLRHYSAMGA